MNCALTSCTPIWCLNSFPWRHCVIFPWCILCTRYAIQKLVTAVCLQLFGSLCLLYFVVLLFVRRCSSWCLISVSLLRSTLWLDSCCSLMADHWKRSVFPPCDVTTVHQYFSLWTTLCFISFYIQYTAVGGAATLEFLRRAFASLTYRDLCLPDDITGRGLDSIPGYYYRDDGLRLWDIIHRCDSFWFTDTQYIKCWHMHFYILIKRLLRNQQKMRRSRYWQKVNNQCSVQKMMT